MGLTISIGVGIPLMNNKFEGSVIIDEFDYWIFDNDQLIKFDNDSSIISSDLKNYTTLIGNKELVLEDGSYLIINN